MKKTPTKTKKPVTMQGLNKSIELLTDAILSQNEKLQNIHQMIIDELKNGTRIREIQEKLKKQDDPNKQILPWVPGIPIRPINIPTYPGSNGHWCKCGKWVGNYEMHNCPNEIYC